MAVSVLPGVALGAASGAIGTVTRVPRILSLLAFVGILWYVNQSAPRVVPAVLGLIVLYVALTHVGRVSALFGSAETSVATAFAPPAPKAGRRQ